MVFGMGHMEGKVVVIMGVANERSIAWGVAKSLYREGARGVFTYRKERSLVAIKKLLEENDMQSFGFVQCDVADDASITAAFDHIKQAYGVIHGIVHSIASADPTDLKDDFLNVERDNFLYAQNISVYSLIAVAKAAQEVMAEGGAIVTQSYLGAERVVKNYNVMGVAKAALESSVKYLAEDLGKHGIRVNAVSAGPIRTISAKGVSGFNDLFRVIEQKAPLRRNVDQDEVGDATFFLLSNLARGITGEVLHVDAGYHIIGV